MIRLFTKTRRRKTRDGFSPSPLIRELDAAGYVRVTDAVTADQPSEITQAQFQGLVSGSGISYADVATTPGSSPGERRTLSDGPDAGAALIWAIPEGSASYAWCWAIYPLASYL